MNTNKVTGKCALCGNIGELSFEHVPPKSAFNDKPIFLQGFNHLIDKNNQVYGKRIRRHQGLGVYTLCKKCNNNTGNWYAKDFSSFVQQGMDIIKSVEPQPYISGEYLLKPLNVFKQIITMFMSANGGGGVQLLPSLKNFVLKREENIFPSNFKIFLYSNLSAHNRMIGYSIVSDPTNGIQKWSEINFKPFGYLLADDSNPAHIDMLDITSFSQFKYDEEVKMNITTRYLGVSSPFIGTYD